MLRGGRETVAVETPARSGTLATPGLRVTDAVAIPAFSMREFSAAPACELPVRASVPFSRVVSCEAEFVLTKRCSRGSYAMEESLLNVTTREAVLPASTVRDRRAGGAETATLLVNASRGGCLKTFQLVPVVPVAPSETPRPPTSRTPCARLIGVLPRASSGWAGTSPSVPPECTQTAVTGRQEIGLFQTPKPVGAQTQPNPGSKSHPPK